MNEAALLRALRQCRKVRGPDFHQPATRANQGKIENGDGGVEKVGVLSFRLLCKSYLGCSLYCVHIPKYRVQPGTRA